MSTGAGSPAAGGARGDPAGTQDGTTGAEYRASAAAAPAELVDFFRAFARAVRARQLYLPNNPVYIRALEAVRESLAPVWARDDWAGGLTVEVRESELVFGDAAVLVEEGRGGESVPWVFFKDGVRTLTLFPGIEGDELDRFLDVIQAARLRTGDESDVVTLLWEGDFEHVGYEYVEPAADGTGAPGGELLHARPRGGSIQMGGTEEPAGESDGAGEPEAASAPALARVREEDTTLYFLDESEIRYLREAIATEFSAELTAPVASALLDTFELETAPGVRAEIADVLRGMLIQLLARRDVGGAAWLLAEAAIAVERARGLGVDDARRLASLGESVSDAGVLAPLLDALDEADTPPPEDELARLLGELHPAALEVILRYLTRARSPGVRAAVERVATRMAAAHTGELVRMIESTEDDVALEAIQRAGDLRTTAAVAALGRVLEGRDASLRLAALRALQRIGTPGALQLIERALEDADRAVRIAAAEGVAVRGHRAAAQRLERVTRERVIRDGSAAEKGAFFDALAVLAGEGSIDLLSGIALPRGLFARREDSATRAAAVSALGKVRSERATDVLRRAAQDRDVVVRSAATRALRADRT